MQIIVNGKMEDWVAKYIHSHRKEGAISIHVVYSKFNEDFRATFNVDPQVAIRLMEASGFLKGSPAKGGYSIWLTKDIGQGQCRPYRSRVKCKSGSDSSAEAKKQSAEPSTQKEKSMANPAEKSEKKLYNYEKVPHPKTGKVGNLELIKYIVAELSARWTVSPERDGGYTICKLSMTTNMLEIGVPSGARPALSRIMQEMGLIKCYGYSNWGVLDLAAAEYFITKSSYIVAEKEMKKRHLRNKEIATLRKQLAKSADQPQSTTVPAEPVSGVTESFEEEAIEALVEAERLADVVEAQKAAIAAQEEKYEAIQAENAAIKAELNARPVALTAAKVALSERIKLLKTATAP